MRYKFSILFFVYCFLAAVVASVLITINFRLYTDVQPAAPDLLHQLAHIRTALDKGAATEMQELFPEGAMFTYLMYGLSCAELAKTLPDTAVMRRDLIAEARRAIRAIESSDVTAFFPASLSPPHGMFYAGWSSFLRGNTLEATPVAERPAQEIQRLADECDRIAHAVQLSATPWLQSYQGAAWPADNLAAMAALCVHDRILPPRYQVTTAGWLRKMRRYGNSTGLLPHAVDAETGGTTEPARGCSQSLMIRLLVEIDTVFARQQYQLYRQQFTGSVFGLPGIREYPAGTTGTGDVDSGPVVFGIGSSATIAGLGTAIAVGDAEWAEQLEQMVETLGMPLTWKGQKCYIGGALPVADAFLAWSKSAHLKAASQSNNPVAAAPRWWRLPTHAFSLFALLLLALPVAPAVQRRYKLRKQKA